MGGGERSSWRLKKAAKKIFVQTCCGSFFCHTQHPQSTNLVLPNVACDSPNFSSSYDLSGQRKGNRKRSSTINSCNNFSSEINVHQTNSNNSPPPSSRKNLCAICLDPLNYCSGSSPGQAIFTAQCTHAFHFTCISSNVRHGSVTCPICRAHWTQLPRNLNTLSSLHYNKSDPVLQILDDSIANSRVHRRSSLRSTRYDDDDPIEPDHSTDQPRLHLSLLTAAPLTDHRGIFHSSGSSSMAESPNNGANYLHVKLAHQPATDVVLVASPNGPHLRLMKHAMALVVSSLRPTDRLAIVTYSSTAARVFPLRRMTSYGKRTALQIINRLFHMGQADPLEGLKKGVKILGDRVHNNPESCILHLTDSPSRSYHQFDEEVPVTVHRFHVGVGFGASSGLVMHDFEEFLARTLGGAIRDVQLRIGERAGVVRIGELRGGEERNIPVYVGESGHVCVEYCYVDGECIKTGEIVVGTEDRNSSTTTDDVSIGGRMSSAESWDYHDPFMARRWAKHLHGYRL